MAPLAQTPMGSPDPRTSPSVAERAAMLADSPGPILRAVFEIAKAWNLRREQTMALIGIDSVSVYSGWKRKPDSARLKLYMIERISYTLAIWESLNVLLPKPNSDTWVHQPNAAPLFGGRPAIELMCSGLTTDLAAVRHHLDGERYR